MPRGLKSLIASGKQHSQSSINSGHIAIPLDGINRSYSSLFVIEVDLLSSSDLALPDTQFCRSPKIFVGRQSITAPTIARTINIATTSNKKTFIRKPGR